MIAILGGLGAATLWAAANLISSRSSRLIGAASTLGWMLLVGLIMGTPFAVASGPLPPLTPILTLWMAGSAFGSTIGLLFLYRGLKIGKVGVVTALASTEGAMAALIAVARGEAMTPIVALMLCVITGGVAAVALATGGKAEPAEIPAEPGTVAKAAIPLPRFSAETRAALFGSAAALCFGFGIYATGQLGESLPPFVAILPVRVVGVVCVLIPLAIAGRLRMSRAAAPMVFGIGAAELFGNVSYVIGAKESIAIAAVLASQYAAVAAVAAFFLFRERLSVTQRSGVLAIALGVAALTAVRG